VFSGSFMSEFRCLQVDENARSSGGHQGGQFGAVACRDDAKITPVKAGDGIAKTRHREPSRGTIHSSGSSTCACSKC
jgi:hypothetical protein